MKGNLSFKKVGSILLTVMMTVTMLVPGMLFPKEARAATTYNAYFQRTGRTVVVNWGNLNGEYGGYYDQNAEYFSTSPYSGKTLPGFCVDPSQVFRSGERTANNLNGYKSPKTGHVFNRTEDKRLAIGLHYIRNRATNIPDYPTRITMCQLFTWEEVKGKYTPYKAWLDLDSGNNRALKELFDIVRADAEQYINEHWSDMDGWCYVYRANSQNNQDIITFEIIELGKAKLKKATKNNKHLTDLCPEQYSLRGAKYEVYKNSSLTGYAGTLTTDYNGESNAITLSGGTYYVKETVAPPGYKLDNNVYTLKVTNGQTTTLNVSDEPLFDPLSLKIKKKAEKGADKSLSLEGAEYTVKYYKSFLNESQVRTATPFRTWVFKTDKNGEFRLRDRWYAGGDDLFREEDGTVVGLHGTYVVEEKNAPYGFARTEGIISLQHVKPNSSASGVTVLKDVTDVEKTQKVNIKVEKKDAETGEAKPQGYGSFAGAKFNVWFYDPLKVMDVLVGTIITNEYGTGELVKLKPGVYTIEEIEPPNGYNKNTNKVKIDAKIKEKNTAYFDYFASIAEKPITVTVEKTSIDEVGARVTVAGADLALFNEKGTKLETWTSDGNVHTFKALPKGNYYIKELRPPEGYLPLEEDYKFTVKETEDTQKHEVFNELIPEVKTLAKFDTGVKESLPKKEVTVLDKFEYKKVLKDHPYEIRAKLVEKDNIGNVIAECNQKFTTKDYKGEEELKFTFNAEKLEGKRLVVLAELHRLDRKGSTLVAVHKDINNIDETVVFPKVRTTATDKIDNGKDMFAGEKQTIVDKVSYSNLIIGRTYKLTGKLMNKETGEPILDNGKEVTAEKEFTAETSNGFMELEFTFNASALKGKTVVVFEDVYVDKVKVATHSEIKDKEQSIYIPKIGTKLTGKGSEAKEFHAFSKVRFTDEIKYENLIKGKVYYVKGQIINKKSGEVLKEAEGNFIAEDEKGIAKLDFVLDAQKLKGVKLVCFEEMYTIDDEGNPSKKVAEHKDIEDEGQTVEILDPKIGTKLTGENKEDKELHAFDEIKLVDEVNYKNLIKGRKYYLKGKVINKKTGETLAEAETSFKANGKTGTTSIEFKLNAEELKDANLVCFEEVYTVDNEDKTKKLIAEHKDIEDEGQTVRVVNPEIGTKATTDNGKKKTSEDKVITIVDKVSYKDLIIGKEYTIKGKLMDKETGEPLIVNGKEVTAEKTFKAKKKDGEEELIFKFDAKGLGGKTVVVFEDVYQDGKLIGTHSDINDTEQSIKIYKLGKITISDKDKFKRWGIMTGDKQNIFYSVLGLGIAISLVVAIRLKKRNKL